MNLAGKTLFITGASRGIGKAIGLQTARDDANVVIAAKTAETHPKLPGTIYSAAEEIEQTGGRALPLVVDVRAEEQVYEAVAKAVETFGGIDILVNNASAIQKTGTLETAIKRFDLIQQINTRGTFLCSQVCIPQLKKAANPHVLNISPPLNLAPHWFAPHLAYTIAKYGMSLCVLGMAEEFRHDGIAFNALWPKTSIWTAAMAMLAGPDIETKCRTVDIVADAAYIILNKPAREFTGRFCIDEELLRAEGINDFARYRHPEASEEDLRQDIFL